MTQGVLCWSRHYEKVTPDTVTGLIYIWILIMCYDDERRLNLAMIHFKQIAPYLPDGLNKTTLRKAIRYGWINIGQVFETALSNISGIPVDRQFHQDFETGDDAKLVTSIKTYREYVKKNGNRGIRIEGRIKNFHNKTGNFAIQVYERYTNKFYYFYIPYKKYSMKSCVNIPFDVNGIPRRDTKRTMRYDAWNYEKLNIEDLAFAMTIK